ncbi:hypothetical protein B296_00005318 [Ensete ventricosum]|uniref:Uncharacterized protein n=1 Tax=Ensete ventricosum TaxID=4639 RepID=A0A427A0Z6_ENSVE|nr:hypothetical protein B296_00005318 [Ensete ventricosum]
MSARRTRLRPCSPMSRDDDVMIAAFTSLSLRRLSPPLHMSAQRTRLRPCIPMSRDDDVMIAAFTSPENTRERERERERDLVDCFQERFGDEDRGRDSFQKWQRKHETPMVEERRGRDVATRDSGGDAGDDLL